MSKRIVILGGYGVFGGRLAMALAKDARFDVVVAGRALSKATKFCAEHGGTPAEIDLQADDLETRLAALAPFVTVDAAGPFQAYAGTAPYRLAKAAITCGSHYLDLSDDAAFTTGITALDRAAKDARVAVISGVSSVPALSSAVVGALAADMADIHAIQSAILPGNRAPRGLSVIRAIVAQAGRPMNTWQANQWHPVRGWSGATPMTLHIPGKPKITGRAASFIGAPDIALFPEHFKARTVLFRAGLDLKIMHHGLTALSLPVRAGLLKSITALSRPLKWAAELLKPFGSDRGGMLVKVTGQTEDDQNIERLWTLLAEGGDGPHIPAVPARLLCEKWIDTAPTPGARPALQVFSLPEAETALKTLDLHTHQTEREITPLFEAALGEAYPALPTPLRALHTVLHRRRWIGEASITRGTGLLSKFAGWCAGFPPATDKTPVQVEMIKTPQGETWNRQFGKHRFRSRLSRDKSGTGGQIRERFGLMRFTIGLKIEDDALWYPVIKGTCLGVPLPGFLMPKSQTCERADAQGRATFNVTISLPLAGHVVSYSGWLEDAKL